MTPFLYDSQDKHILLDDVIRQIKDLPTLPTVAQEMLSNLEDDDTSLDMICEKVAMDQSLAAKTLRLANSSYYGANSKVVTLQQAVALLGIKNIKKLILMTSLTNSFPTSRCRNFDSRAFWRHSIATAICAELISRTLKMKHDFAFTAGLLHDIGRLVLVTRFPKEYEQVIAHREQQDCYLLDAEQTVLGIDHVSVGLVLAMQWEFSDAIQDAISGHHQPDNKDLNPVAAIVHVANSIVHGLDLSEAEHDLVPVLSKHAWDTLGLSEADYLAIFRETEMRFDAINQVVP
ncbi:MAG: HDOD domain-containing protein [Undibacterium sp.]|nr:HDOD domain-containing protein [Undibacterium sp.]